LLWDIDTLNVKEYFKITLKKRHLNEAWGMLKNLLLSKVSLDLNPHSYPKTYITSNYKIYAKLCNF
jgi:hypothetical protein